MFEDFHFPLQLNNCCSVCCSTSDKSVHGSDFASWGLFLSHKIRPAEEGKILKESGKCLCLCSLLWYQLFSSQGKKSKVQQRNYSRNLRVSLAVHFPEPLPLWCLTVELIVCFFSSLVSFLFTCMCHRVKSYAPLFFVKLAVSHGGKAALANRECIQDKKQIQL